MILELQTTFSVYRIDTDKKEIWRVRGENRPTARFGQDGERHAYEYVYPSPPVVGERVLVQWPEDEASTLLSIARNVVEVPAHAEAAT